MADIFLSYKKEDRDRISALADHFQAEGFTVWYDYQIETGQDWFEQILREIDVSRVVIGCWSKEAVASSGEFSSRYVMLEHRRAPQKLLPILLDEGRIPFEFSSVQAVDLTRWDGDRSSEEWRRLVAQIEDLATPIWMRRRIAELQAALSAEHAKRSAAEAKATPIEMRLQDEARKLGEAQIALRAATERADQLLQERDAAQAEAVRAHSAADAPPPVLTPKGRSLFGWLLRLFAAGFSLAVKYAVTAGVFYLAALVIAFLAVFSEWGNFVVLQAREYYNADAVVRVASPLLIGLSALLALIASVFAAIVALRVSNLKKPMARLALLATCCVSVFAFMAVFAINTPPDMGGRDYLTQIPLWSLASVYSDYSGLSTSNIFNKTSFMAFVGSVIAFFLPKFLVGGIQGASALMTWLFGFEQRPKTNA